MSTLQIEERITVHAPPKRVWKFLLDPARVAACLPGAKLDGTEGEDTFLGTMKIKVGPVVMEIKGKATMSHIDPVERRVTLSGMGNDKAGGGSARMDMKSQILEVDGGGSEILVHADVHLAGKLVRFGRGMMEGISKQLFKQFAERVHVALDEDDDEDEEEEAHEGEAPVEKGAPPAETAAAKAEPAAAARAEEAPPAKEEEAPPAKEVPGEEKAPPAEGDAGSGAVEKAPSAESQAGSPPAEAAQAIGTETSEEPEKAPPADTTGAKAGPADAAPAEAKTEEAPPAEPDKGLREAALSKDEATSEAPSPSKTSTKPEAPAKGPSRSASPGGASLATTKKKKPTKKPLVAPADNAPLDAGGLVWAAIWAWIKGLFARIFSR